MYRTFFKRISYFIGVEVKRESEGGDGDEYIFLYIFASAAPQRPTCSYNANPVGLLTRN